MGQYTHRSTGTMVAGTGAIAPGMPAGWQPDDLLALYTTCVSTSETLDAEDVGEGWVEAAVADAGGHENLKLFLKAAEEGDTSPSLNWSGTSNSCAQIAAFHGDVFTDLATIVAHVVSRESVTTRPKIWGLTVTTPGCLILTMSRIVKSAVSNGTTYNPPTAAITELGEYEANGTNIAAVWGYQIQQAAANIAEASWSPQGTAESSNQNFLALTVALKSSSATVNAQGAGGTATSDAADASAQGSSGVTAQGEAAVAAAVAAAATVSTDTQQIIVAAGSPSGSALSLRTMFDPAVADGDVYIVDKLTTPGGYAVTVNADGTFWFDGGGDESRQLIGVDVIQASNGRRRGLGYVAVNSVAPQLVGSAGGFIGIEPLTPFAPMDLRLHEQIRDPQGGTLTFDLRSGPLPPGLRLTRGGRLYGVPIALGSYPVTFGIRDAYGALTIIDDIIDVAYGATGAGATVEATAATATAGVSVSASGAGGTVTVSAAAGGASGGGGGGGDSITANAYAAYATRVVDSATSSDVAGGTTRTVSVNGESGSYQCYKTIAYAVNDYLTAGGRRLIVKSGNYTLTADVPFPSATGLSDSARVVLMGDPADTMPAITTGAYTFWPNRDGARSYITFRKLELKDGIGLATAGNSANAGAIWTANAAGSATFMNSEFLDVHDYTPDSIDNSALLELSNTADCIVRYCKLRNISRSGSGGNYYADNNLNGILGYDADRLLIHNCDISNARNGIRAKRMTENADHGWTVSNNRIFDTYSAFNTEVSSAGNPPHIGHVITKNLVWSTVFEAKFLDAELIASLGGQSSAWTISHNTVDVPYSMILTGVTGWDIHSNAFVGGSIRHFETLNSSPNSQSFTRINYNAWRAQTASTWRLYNSGSQLNLSSVAAWKTADSVSGAADLSADPDANGVNVTSLSAEFTDTSSRDYSLKAGSQLLDAGLSGADIGFDSSDFGAGW